jgi:hypothetical protein
MNHTQAIGRGCAENYLLGEMEDGERLEFEEHFFDCRECAEDIKTAVAFAKNAKEVFETEPPEVEFPASVAAFKPGRPRLSRPLSTLAAAALVFVACAALYQAVAVVPGLRREVALVNAPQAVRWEFLSVSRSKTPVVVVSPRHRLLGLRLSKSSAETYAEYQCELRDGDGRTVQSSVISAPPPGEEFGLVLPLSGLESGAYVMILSGLGSPQGPVIAPELARYRFTLQLSED